ncbi:MAG: Ig-like domain-containing protein [Myxococcota bacterium]
MAKRLASLAFCLAMAGCGDSDNGSGPSKPDIVQIILPADGTEVTIIERVRASIDRADANAEGCRFSMGTTTMTVSQGGTEVPGSLVFFVGGLRIDFTPSGLFDFSTGYDVEVIVDCAVAKTATFTTEAADGSAPTVAAGDLFRMDTLAISEPGAIAPILRRFLANANMMVRVMGYDAQTLSVLGGEGQAALDPDWPRELRVFNEAPFLFPMTGIFKWPYFQIEGSLSIPIDVSGQADTEIVLPRFEISGLFVGTSPDTAIPQGSIRASAACDDVCQVDDDKIQMVCANRSLICDEAGMMNLVGSYEAGANDLRPYHTITIAGPAADATGVATDATIDVVFSSPVDATRNGSVVVELRDAADTLVTGTMAVATDGLSSTFTPGAALTGSTTYTVLVVALDAIEWRFTTQP